MALRSIQNVPVLNKENPMIGKGISGISTRGALTRAALGDVQNKIAVKSRVPVAAKPVQAESSKAQNKNNWIKSEAQARPAFSSQLLPPDVPNVDKDDSSNPQLCSDYVMDIFDYLRQLEATQSVDENFLSIQTEVTPRMRSILVDWLVQVHDRFNLLQETLYLTISFLDRFLQKQPVSKSNLQLLGVSAMFLASKYEEMYAPEVNDFVYITDNAYKKREIFKMEMAILRTLDFDLGRPLPLHFLRRYSKVADCDAATHTVAKYLMELSLQDSNFSRYNPSKIAAAALKVALKCLDNKSWNPVLSFYTKYEDEELMELSNDFVKMLRNAEKSKLQAVRKKYSGSKFMKISLLPQLQFVTL